MVLVTSQTNLDSAILRTRDKNSPIDCKGTACDPVCVTFEIPHHHTSGGIPQL